MTTRCTPSSRSGVRVAPLPLLLLLSIWISGCAATGNVIAPPDPNFTTWSPAGALPVPVSHSTVLFYNETLLSIGGCLSLDCLNQSNLVAFYSPLLPAFPEGALAQGEGRATESATFPPLTFPISGYHTAVSFSGLVYVVRSCSMLIPGAPVQTPSPTSINTPSPPPPDIAAPSFWESKDTMRGMGGSTIEDLLGEYSVVSEYDPSTGAVNDSFFSIPSEYVRANASCVNIANTIYIVGGFNITTGEGLRTVDALDIMAQEFTANVTEIDVALSNPSVSTDYVSIYVAGGRLTAVAGRHMNEAAVNRLVWRFVPFIGNDGAYSCSELLPILPQNFTDVTNATDVNSETELSIVSLAGYLAVVNAYTSRAAVLPLHFNAPSKNPWSIVDWRAANTPTPPPPNTTAPSTQDGPLPPNETISAFPMGAAVGYIVTTLGNVSNRGGGGGNRTAVGSQLILYRFGGVVQQRQWLTDNISIVVPVLSSNISVSAARSILTLPVDNLKQRVISSGLFQFGMRGSNTTSVCQGSVKTTPCRVRLSSRLDCIGNAAGTFDAPWDGVHDVVFTATGASFPVYVCFTWGMDHADACGGMEVSPTFFNTDLLNPLDLQNGPITPAPPPSTPAPHSGDTGTSLSTLLYIFGAVAAVTTLVAVLLVAKLRRVPDEGLIAARTGGHPVVGYGTHQEERYKILGKIGEGAFSIVYLVARRADNARFAMKHMECQSDIQRQEAIKECEIMRSLQGHPNVINLYDMFMNYEFDVAEPPGVEGEEAALLSNAANGTPKAKRSRHLCLVMEYHAAGDLRRWALSHRGPISEPVLCSIAFQVTSVLKHIHAQDPAVIHRDLKPENILIVSLDDEHQRANAVPSMELLHSSNIQFLPVVITDFGLARIQEGTYCASGAGTLPYVAPECFKKKYTVQCDMWSLGCVLYAVTTKRCSHDSVRLMFQDCEQPNFHATIAADLAACGTSKTFVEFVQMLIEPDMRRRLTADQAFKMFRKKDNTVFLSSRVVLEKAAALAARGSRRSTVVGAAPTAPLQEECAPPQVPEPPPPREEEGGSVQAEKEPDSETSIHSESQPDEL